MKLLTHIVAALATVSITSTSVVKSPVTPGDGNFELLILHNNDMHARFEQTSQLSGTCTTADREAGKCYGGFPRVAYVVKEARRAAAAGEGPPVLYLNAGDTYTGTAWFTIYKWKIAAEFINALQPDAVSLGNNEIDGDSWKLSPFLENIDTKILASNVNVKGKTEILHKSVIFNIKGVKVGLVGYLTPETSILDSSGEIEYVDEVLALTEEVAKLQAQNVGIIIAIGHASLEKDIEVAREVEGLDLVIAGRKNTFLWNGMSLEEQKVDDAISVTQKSGKQVPVVQSYAYNNYLGQLRAQFDAAGEITDYTVQPIALDESIPQDAQSVQLINKLNDDMTTRTEEVVGQTAVVLDGVSCRTEECNLGNLIADAVVYYYALRFEGERWTDAPAAFIHAGHLAASVAPTNRPADVTLGDLLTALPYESNLVAVTMSGTVLLSVLEHAVANYSTVNPTDQLLQFSGIRVVYDLSRESGSRVVSSVVRCWACSVPEFYDIDSWRTYKILMPVSIANGGSGYSMLTGLTRDNLEYDEVTCLAEYLRLRSPVYPDVAGRIEILNYVRNDTTTVAPTTIEANTTTVAPTTIEANTTTVAPTTMEANTTPQEQITDPGTSSAIALSSSLVLFVLMQLKCLI